ncbi:UBX domain-containing protein 4 isoform X2 [Syngnathus scovelli]|uniref:UBX domain-containing protein 4 isoform X2 n=1 Tax=Syngnathus scovelli TaxID=161590 RepID=UPI0021103A69|nr:UBX domain-containing protein 4 isoform X2 [Syngnathus scovelli]
MSITFTMIWFSGSIPDAIDLAKQRKFVFVIVITGNDEQSANLIASWEDDSVAETAQKCCVAIKIDAESETCVQFSQIYPVVCVPSSFFIGENGVPLEVIAGSVSAEELRIRIDQVQQMHAQKIGTRMVSQETATTLMTSPTQPTMAALSAPLVPVIPPEELIRPSALDDIDPREAAKAACCQSAVTTAASEYPHPTNVSFISEANPDMKRHRRKTTLENEDCVDRAALHSKTLEHKAQQITLQAKQTELEAVKGTFVKPRSTTTRLQFRLPDGSSFTNQFSSQNKLQEVNQFVIQEVGNRNSNFSMATMFPRREFTSEDLNKTLLELGLSPSSSIVLLPRGRPACTIVPSTGGGMWAFLSTLFYPVLTVWRFVTSFTFQTPPQEPSRSSFALSQSYINPAMHSNKPKRESLSKPSINSPKNFKKDGNICQLRAQEDSEDDNNTWNGNSTQQM